MPIHKEPANVLDYDNSPHNPHSPNFVLPSQAHLSPNGNNYFNYPPHPSATSPPPGPYSANPSFPSPPPNVYHGPSPYPYQPQQLGPGYISAPPFQHPGMLYGPPQQPQFPQEVFLGIRNDGYTQKPIYGPPGSTFDSMGNVYFERADGYKDYVGPYRGYDGRIRTPPPQRGDNDGCC